MVVDLSMLDLPMLDLPGVSGAQDDLPGFSGVQDNPPKAWPGREGEG